MPREWPILFAPDRNLGKYLIKETGRDLLLWDGACVVHEAFSFNKLINLQIKYPGAKLLAHPESESEVLELAHFIGSTNAMIDYVRNSEEAIFLIATEAGILHQMKKEAFGKTLIPVPVSEDNTCACSECAYMRMNTLEKLYRCLRDETPEITVSADIAEKALLPVLRMLEISKN